MNRKARTFLPPGESGRGEEERPGIHVVLTPAAILVRHFRS